MLHRASDLAFHVLVHGVNERVSQLSFRNRKCTISVRYAHIIRYNIGVTSKWEKTELHVLQFA